MMVRMYSIYDRVAREYCFPMSAKNDAVAVREFQASFAECRPNLAKDYELVFVAWWDSEKGTIDQVGFPKAVDMMKAIEEAEIESV